LFAYRDLGTPAHFGEHRRNYFLGINSSNTMSSGCHRGCLLREGGELSALFLFEILRDWLVLRQESAASAQK
jgi:hypothetical protein